MTKTRESAGLLTRAELRERLAKLPRIKLGNLPTPLEEMPRLSEALGGPRILIKRDDATGLAFGGNKVRHYEFEMGHVRDQGYDALVNIMDYHSNNARLTGAAANKTGLKYVLILKNSKGRAVQGNRLVDKILGAEVHDLDAEESKHATEYARKIAQRLEKEGFKPYLLQDHEFPKIAGTIAYLDGGLELAQQLDDRGITKNAHIFGVAGRSTAGLVLTSKNLGLGWKVTGVTVTYDNTMKDYLYDVVGGAVRTLNLPIGFEPSDMEVLTDYVGEGYGIMTQEVGEAIHMFARNEAIFVDPNYTGTVAAALIDQIRKGRIGKDEIVVFLHTGGLPAIFTFAKELAAWQP
jgi:D-cysteine desulfhydrase/L-cysteate sulfo-lyase